MNFRQYQAKQTCLEKNGERSLAGDLKAYISLPQQKYPFL